jgi:hypothetical protein
MLNKKTSSLGSNQRHAACRLLNTAHHLRRAVRALQTLAPSKESELVTLLRVRDRVEGIARLLSEATENLKLAGVNKNDPIIEIDGNRLGLQKLSRRLRKVRAQLDNEYAAMTMRTRSGDGHGPAEGGSGQQPSVQGRVDSAYKEAVKTGSAIGGWVALGYVVGGWLADLFNQEDDDIARKRISEASHDEIRHMSDNELVDMMNAMLDGPTGDDDEAAILKIFEALDCQRRIHIVNRVGLDQLLSDVDGEDWDKLVSLLTECGIIGIDKLDDGGSREFVYTRTCAQLGQLSISAVRQLVLNMFSGNLEMKTRRRSFTYYVVNPVRDFTNLSVFPEPMLADSTITLTETNGTILRHFSPHMGSSSTPEMHPALKTA